MGNSEKRASYILVTRNRAAALRVALANVRKFYTPVDEVLIIDGGSTDDTSSVVAEYADLSPVFVSEPDSGPTHAVNKGILLSRGRYVVNLTDDDYFYPDGVRLMIDTMETHPDIDVLTCGGEIYVTNSRTGVDELGWYQRLPSSMSLQSNLINLIEYVPASYLCIRKSVVARIGLFDSTSEASDIEMVARLLRCGCNLKFLNIKLFRFNFRPISRTTTNSQSSVRSIALTIIRDRRWDLLMSRDPSDSSFALGLDEVKKGELLYDIIWYADRLRSSKVPVLSFIRWFLIGIERIRLWKWRCAIRRGHVGISNDRPPSRPKVEPVWDGRLI